MRPKKSLGQNFLKSKEALRLIIEAGNLKPDDIILEVGPGKGVLTAELLAKTGRVIAVEKDDRLVGFLKEKFASEIAGGKLLLIHGDILKLNFDNLGKVMNQNATGTIKYKLIANIPYYITGALLKKFLQGREIEQNQDVGPANAPGATPAIVPSHQPQLMVLLVQKEVAERIVALDGKESILSISVKAYGTPRYVKTVKAKYFSPEPKVDSAIIAIENISKDFFQTDLPVDKTSIDQRLSEEKFFDLIKTGFAHKRKILRGNLGVAGGNVESGNSDVGKMLDAAGLQPTVRAEDVSIDTWKKIFLLTFPLKGGAGQ